MSYFKQTLTALTQAQIAIINGAVSFENPAPAARVAWAIPQVNPAYLMAAEPAKVRTIQLNRRSFGGN